MSATKNANESQARHWITSALTEQTPAAIPAELTIQKISEYAKSEGITPLLRYQLHQSGQLSALPVDLQDSLAKADHNYAAADLAAYAELRHLADLFKKNRLDVILLKGEALAHSVYPEPHLRTRCDIDLIFRDSSETERAWLILAGEDYQREMSLSGKFVGYQFGCQKLFANGISTVLDIHHQITNYIWFNRKLEFDDLYANTVALDLDGIQISILNPVYALIHACVHRVTNKSKHTENRLIWLYDIHLLSQKLSTEEWRTLLARCHDKGLSTIVLQGLQSTQQALATALPDVIISELAELADREPDSFTKTNRRIQLYLSDLKHNKGLANKLTQLRERVFPPSEYMQRRYNLQNKTWLWYYYLKRIVNVVTRR